MSAQPKVTDVLKTFVEERAAAHVFQRGARPIKIQRPDGTIGRTDSAEVMRALLRREQIETTTVPDAEVKWATCVDCGCGFTRNIRTAAKRCEACDAKPIPCSQCGEQMRGRDGKLLGPTARRNVRLRLPPWICLRCSGAKARQRRPTRAQFQPQPVRPLLARETLDRALGVLSGHIAQGRKDGVTIPGLDQIVAALGGRKAVAELLDCSPVTVYRWLNGRPGWAPRTSIALRLLEAARRATGEPA